MSVLALFLLIGLWILAANTNTGDDCGVDLSL